MKTAHYLVGLVVAAAVLYFAYTGGGYRSIGAFYAGALASTYVVVSSLALLVTHVGRTKKSKGWALFAGGIVLLFGYVPLIRFVVSLFYVPRAFEEIRFEYELFFYSPMIISALCIYRGIAYWAEDSLEKGDPAGTDNSGAAPRRV
jgi:hypothetical protein